MSTDFPTSLDALTNPTTTDNLDSAGVTHAAQHANANDAIEALEAKVGVDGSAVTTSLDYYAKVLAILKTVVDAKGDILVGTAADTIARLAVGANGTVFMADSAQTGGVKWATNVPKTDEANIFTANQSIVAAADSGEISLKNDSATPASGTILGRVKHVGKDDAGGNVTYGELRGVVDDDTAGSEDGWFDLMIRGGGTLSRAFRFKYEGRPYIAFGNDLDTYITSGTGSPEGAVTAGIGSLFLRQDGGAATTLYIKESGSGNTGWVAK